ncbi:MAG: FAD:protein FMN transferase [Clostridia bacterium]|nr:FAD:protein FMN transferase [Clostridia bacterium]
MLKRIFSICLLLILLACPARCEDALKQMRKQTGDYFGTVSALFLYDSPGNTARFESAWAQVKNILARVENAVSLSIPDSDISRFNGLPSGETIEISSVTAAILQTALDVHELTGGLYDPTVYPLVDLWGFSPRFNTNSYRPALPYDRAYENGRLPLPDAAHIRALLPLVGLDGIQLEERDGAFYLTKRTPSVLIDGMLIHAQLDLGGIAKGYACDLVSTLLHELGYTHGHFVCGDSSMAILSRPDGAYSLNMGKPRAGSNPASHFATISVRDRTLSTSSDSRHAYTIDGVRYCHIIDPRTGYPINMPQDGVQKGAASITLLASGAARSDAITTALCLMQPQDAVRFADTLLPGDGLIITLYASDSDMFEVIHNLDQGAITLSDPAYRLASETDAQGNTLYTGSFFAN